jgi:hypothetical protein
LLIDEKAQKSAIFEEVFLCLCGIIPQRECLSIVMFDLDLVKLRRLADCKTHNDNQGWRSANHYALKSCISMTKAGLTLSGSNK